MPFCCIAIVGVAVLYFLSLWARQLFSGPRRDAHGSPLPAPPRAMVSHGALPVYGHTFLFTRYAGSAALLFDGERDFEYGTLPLRLQSWLPSWCCCSSGNSNGGSSWSLSRKLGDCFAIYIWGQWRVCIQGPERTKQVFDQQELKEAFPWTPPLALLGKSCLPFLDDRDADQLRTLLQKPLSHKTIVQYAWAFAELAETCLDETVDGKFSRHAHAGGRGGIYNDEIEESRHGDDDEDEDVNTSFEENNQFHKLKWEALRSYTFDLVDGPVLAMNLWRKPSAQSHGQESSETSTISNKASNMNYNANGQQRVMNTEDSSSSSKRKKEKKSTLPHRETMLLYMERIKSGVDTIKLTFGPEWMYIWLMNEYGRALNGRLNVQSIFSKHVARMSETVPVEHRRGHSYNDPTTQMIPLLTWRENLIRDKEGIFGLASISEMPNRSRCNSAPAASVEHFLVESEDDDDDDEEDDEPSHCSNSYMTGYDSPSLASGRKRAMTAPDGDMSGRNTLFERDRSPAISRSNRKLPKKEKKKQNKSVLESLLREQDFRGNGISQAVMVELSITLWMMMDVGNAWTAMALNLLASDREAGTFVQEELDALESEFGRNKLFSPSVLRNMKYMDALLYEAIRLCPAFLGGLKQTTTTIEFKDIGVQLPKNTHIFFCQPTNMKFDIQNALGQKPEQLGGRYPCEELHGFLPLQGLEVPLMVLQCKVFLIVTLQKYSPLLSKKRTLIRRVKSAMPHLKHHRHNSHHQHDSATTSSELLLSLPPPPPPPPPEQLSPASSLGSTTTPHEQRGYSCSQRDEAAANANVLMDDLESDNNDLESGNMKDDHHSISQSQAMRLFTKIPFPEPRRVIYLRPREME